MNNSRQYVVDDDVDAGSPSILATLWEYRRTIAVALGVTALCCLMAALFAYVWSAKERVASLGFQLTFEGADRGEYPNGTKFSSAELLSTPVLTEVFAANELERYGRFSDFKDSIFVLQTNRDLELLSYEYESKLSDAKLSPVDRARLEEEFNKKRESLRSAGYSLNIRRRERLSKLPDSLLNKILQDTLSTWARHAADKKGAARYNIAVLSKNALQKDMSASEDYIIAADRLRAKIERILKSVVEMSEIPGASAVRMPPEQIGIADLRANLEDLNRFQVEPLIGLIRGTGISRNPVRMAEYFEGRLFEVKLARTEVTQKIKSMQEALREYEQRGAPSGAPSPEPTGQAVTPQVTESFIDKIVELSTESLDLEYRQRLTRRIIDDGMVLAELNRQVEYYEAMRQSFGAVRAGADSAVAADAMKRISAAFDEVSRLLDQVQAFYALLSKQNLNPDAVVYTVTTPFVVRSTSALSFVNAMLYFIVVMLAAMVIVPLACLAHASLRQTTAPPEPERAAHVEQASVGGTGHAPRL